MEPQQFGFIGDARCARDAAGIQAARAELRQEHAEAIGPE